MAPDAGSATRGGAIAFSLMIVAVVLTYLSPEILKGNWRIDGIDYMMLHQRRIDFALEQIREHGTIPAWYPREQMGVPFWSNVQSFPFMPTRLILLAAGAANLFTLAVNLSAILAATFTFLFARRIGVNAIGAAAAGWTFACCGYFASRVLAGQLGMIEGFPALPILLYLIERLRDSKRRSRAWWAAALSIACASFAMSAHPQLPIYAIAAAALYALWRCDVSKVTIAAVAMMLGIGVAAIQLWPMAALIARSSRVLALDPPTNDVVLPYWRLASLVLPWHDGAPDQVRRRTGVGDFSHPRTAEFWDTVNYIGLLPLIAVLALPAWCLWRRRRPGAPALFLAVMGAAALLLALPLLRDISPGTPFIVLRSPSRLMYLVSFSLALALGGSIHALSRSTRLGVMGLVAAGAVLAFHAFDLSRHARCYVTVDRGLDIATPQQTQWLVQTVGDGRVAMDREFAFSLNRRLDDIGFFDSIMLARTYRGLLDLHHISPRTNTQELNGADLSARTLAQCAVRVVMTAQNRPEPPTVVAGNLRIYEIRNAAARVAWFGRSIKRLTGTECSRAMRDQSVDLLRTLVLPPQAPRISEEGTPPQILEPLKLPSRRAAPDRFEISTDMPEPGYVRVIESFDEGWHATVDGAPAAIFPAHNMAMAVPVSAGKHELVMEFTTPGRGAAIGVSAASLLFLAGFLAAMWRDPSGRAIGKTLESAG